MVKLGIIGCGGISGIHTDMLLKLKDRAQVVCVADIDEKKAVEKKEKMGAAKHTTDYHELLKSDVEGVLCCVPTGYHVDIVVDAARAGKQIFCEKPIAMTMDDADRMVKVCKKAEVILQVGFVRRFDDEWLKYRELIQSGVIGRPVIWRSVAGSGMPPAKWFNDEKIGGGPFIDGCVHNFDFARFTFGEAKEVVASLKKFREDTTALDSGTAIVKFKSGDEVMCSWSWGLPDGCRAAGMHDTVGPDGALLFPSGNVVEDKFIEFIICNRKEKNMMVRVEKDGVQRGFYRQMEHFVDCVANGKEPIATGEDGRKALEIALAVIQSGKTGKPVPIGK